jgi:hypothetical protein
LEEAIMFRYEITGELDAYGWIVSLHSFFGYPIYASFSCFVSTFSILRQEKEKHDYPESGLESGRRKHDQKAQVK